MKDIYSVSAVNQYIKSLITSDYNLTRIYVRGEVSNCKYHSSGHIYFTLKDKAGSMACVMFAGQRTKGLTFPMKDGMSVIVFGGINVYERDGRYQLYAAQIVLDGVGKLYEQYEQLKNKLLAEGIFDDSHKKPLPRFPEKIGIVTAPTGAAIQDMIQVSSRRNPYIQIVFYPAKVQGEGAADTVVKGIKALEAYGVDVMIIGRGGGSIEDLWAFNEEQVARAIYQCAVPIVSAVGHETDVTIADFAADLRAPTPSAAAELAVPDILSVLARIDETKLRLDGAIKKRVQQERLRLLAGTNSLKHLTPMTILTQKKQTLMLHEERLDDLIKGILQQNRHRLSLYSEQLKGVSPLSKLSGGFALVSDDTGVPVKSIETVKTGQMLGIDMKDGHLKAKVMDIEKGTR